MCKHEFLKCNDVAVCKKCGLSFTFDGRVLFDRPFPNAAKKKRDKRTNRRKR